VIFLLIPDFAVFM